MTRPGLFVIGAVLLAAGIFAVAWLAGGPAEVAVDDDLAAPQLRPPDELFLGPADPDDSPLEHVERGQFRSVDGDRVQVFSFESFDPRANYLSDFTQPRAELYFADGRLLVIEAPSGTFYHPGSDPQRGSFDRDVVVTFYENVREGELPDATDDQIAVRLFLDEQTNFDRDIGRLVSAGPVLLTGPDAEFTGENLDLTYNTADRRIESMVIASGEMLRIRRPEEKAGTVAPTGTVSDIEEPGVSSAPSNNEQPTQSESVEASTAPPPADNERTDEGGEPTPAQFYRAEFRDDVVVRVGRDEAELLGDALHAYFAFTDDEPDPPTEARRDTQSHDQASKKPTDSVRGSALAQASTDPSTATDTAPALPTLRSRSLFRPHDDDVRITWAGPLQVTPLDQPPRDLEQTDDAILALLGQPATLSARSEAFASGETSNNEASQSETSSGGPDARTTVAADELRYFTASRRVEAQGSTQRPFELRDPAQGQLTGVRLAVMPQRNMANVVGPGRLTAYVSADFNLNPNAEEQRDEASDQPGTPASTTAPPLDITFAQRLRLDFAPPDPDMPADARHTELRRAAFHGDVRALARGQADDEQLDLTTQVLVVDLTTDDRGRTVPTTLTARRQVHAQQPGQSLQADELIAQLAQHSPANQTLKPWAEEPRDEAPDHADDNDNNASPPNLTLDTLTATGHVTVHTTETPDDHDAPDAPRDLPSRTTTLTGHQLVAKPQLGTLTLAGDDADPARVQTPDADLHALQLAFSEPDQALRAQGPGQLVARGADDNTLTVNWSQQLDYDGHAGTAAALGQVKASSVSPTESTRLDAHRLDLTFVPTEAEPNADQPSSPRPQTPLSPDLNFQLRTAHATPDPDTPDAVVVFAAQTPDLNNLGEPATRLVVRGPDLFLENQPDQPDAQRIAVTGPGQMYLEDHRAPEELKPAADTPRDQAPDQNANPLQLSGQGVTFFQWTNALRVNLHTNDLTMHGSVGMLHDPLDGEPKVRLFGDQLTADLTETQPLAALLNQSEISNRQSEMVADPELRRVQIDGRVRVEQTTRRILADQLIYAAADRNVHLEALPGRLVRVYDTDDRNATLEAEAISWNLDRDRIRVTQPRGGVMPVE